MVRVSRKRSTGGASAPLARLRELQLALVFVRWSVTRPGVPTMTCGRLASEMACAMMSMPPTSVDVRMLIAAPSASNCAAETRARQRRPGAEVTRSRHRTRRACPDICSASSRVGDSTSAKNGCGLSSSAWQRRRRRREAHARRAHGCKARRACRIGSAKAPVLPAPVCARPITSLPAPARAMRPSGAAREAAGAACKRRVRTRQSQRHRLALDFGGRLPPQGCARLRQLHAHAQLLEGSH